MAFSDYWIPTGIIGSPIFDTMLNQPSYMQLTTKGHFQLSNQLTVMMWIKPFNFDTSYLFFDATFDDGSETHYLKLNTEDDGSLKIELKDETIKTSEDMQLKEKQWNFIALTFNGETDNSAIFVNEAYGAEDHVSSYFQIGIGYDWISKIFNGDDILIGGKAGTTSFDGSISCLQIFDYAMDPATIQLKRYCSDLPEKADPCPSGFSHFDHYCYATQLFPYNYPRSEVNCLPDVNSFYEKSLAWSENLEHLDFMTYIAKEYDSVIHDIWIGASDRDEDGFFLNSIGGNITIDSVLFDNSTDFTKQCLIAEYGNSGYV